MRPVRVEKCSEADLDLLTEMFGQLVEDEQSDRPWDKVQLREALLKYMRSDSNACFFIDGGTTVGYALVNENASPPYLTHFFIGRKYRRKRYGTESFKALLLELGTDTIDLDVYTWNNRGLDFWESLGFKGRSIRMRYHVPDTK